MGRHPQEPPPAYLATPRGDGPSRNSDYVPILRSSIEIHQPSPNLQMIYAISTLPSSNTITNTCRHGLYSVSAESSKRWAADDKELDANWAKAEKRMEEVVKKLAYSNQKLDRDRLIRGRVQKPILEQEVTWQGMMRRERAKKDEECMALVSKIELERGGDKDAHCCCTSQETIDARSRQKYELGVASIQAVEDWSRTWDQNLDKRRALWEMQKQRWEKEMMSIIDSMMAASPRPR